MSRAAWLLAAIAATAVVWLQSRGLPTFARFWTAVLLVPLPALMVVQARQLHELGALPRRAAYVSTIVSLWVLAFATVLIAARSRFDAAALGFFAAPLGPALLWTAALTLAAIALLFLFRAVGVTEAPVLRELLPTTPPERALFVLVSLTAGICEEVVFRAFLLHSLQLATAAPLLAVALSSGAFGVVHAYQQPVGALRAALLGALLALPLFFGMPIYVPIAVHALIDLISGLWLARYLLR